MRLAVPFLFSRRVPFIPQMETAECGSACLAMVLAYHGHHAPLAELRLACGVGREGSGIHGMARAAKDLGLKASVFQADIEDLSTVPLPAILHWEFRHFVVLERITRRSAWLVDPERGRVKACLETLRKAYTGLLLTLEPDGTFRKRPRRRSTMEPYAGMIRRQIPGLVQILLASLLLQLAGLVAPIGQKILVDQAIARRQEAWLWGLTVASLLALVVQSGLSFLRSWILSTLNTVMDLRLVRGFVQHLLSLPLDFFLQRRNGDLIQRMESATALQHMLSGTCVTAILDVFLVSGYATLMLAFHLRLALLVMGLGLLRLVFQVSVRRMNQQAVSLELAAEGGAHAVLFESLSSLESIKASGAEATFIRRWADHEIPSVNAELRRARLNLHLSSLMGLASSLGTCAVFLVAGMDVLDQRMTIGTFSAFLSLQSLFLAPLGSLIWACGQFQNLGSHLARLDDVLQSAPEQAGNRDPETLQGRVTLEHVRFSYRSAKQRALEDINLEIAPGENVALVGPSGAGKSTLARLLLGMHLPDRGKIRFDGIDLRAFDLARLRSRMGVVLQETFLFNDTVRANLSLHDPGTPLERLQACARIACIHDAVMELPEGYDTVLGENGNRLSGGQRQRLAIARALVHAPAILLLDEATSSLDPETEAQVHANLAACRCTRIVIAHRLATVRDADRILVLDLGRIVQTGTYAELLSVPGLFRSLVEQGWSFDA